MSNTKPWFAFYSRDFWGSPRVATLSPAAVALYLWGLCHQWEHGSLPADPAAIGALAPGMFSHAWAELWAQVEPLFPQGTRDGRRRNTRLERERRAALARADHRSASGERGANKRWGKEIDGTATGQPMVNQCESIARARARQGQGHLQNPEPPIRPPKGGATNGSSPGGQQSAPRRKRRRWQWELDLDRKREQEAQANGQH